MIWAQESAEASAGVLWLVLRRHPTLLAVLVFGVVAIYFSLPGAHRKLRVALAAGAAALAALGVGLIRPDFVWIETALFFVFSGIAVVAGAMMLAQRQPVRSALCFALVVLSTCGLFLLQAAPFLAAATVIVYAGAIIVTFLFIVMLAQQVGLSPADTRSREPFLASIAGGLVLLAMATVVLGTYRVDGDDSKIEELDRLLLVVDRALEEKTLELLKKRIGNIDTVLGRLTSLASEQKKAARQNDGNRRRSDSGRLAVLASLADELLAACRNVDETWLESGEKDIRRELAKLYRAGMRLQLAMQGTIQPPPELALSPYSGTPSNREPQRDRTGRSAMPSDNANALGRSLYVDHLLAVELAGVLLLVATIGAIVIAGRRRGQLR